MLTDETGIQNSNSDQKSSTGEEDAALEFSPTSSENISLHPYARTYFYYYYIEGNT